VSCRALHLPALRSRETPAGQPGLHSIAGEWWLSYSAESARKRRRKLSSLQMAIGIAGQHIEAHRSPSAEDLRRVFETAVREIYQSDLAAKKLQYGIPIVQRAKRLRITQADAEKRALADAARVLAQLWKV